MAFMNVVVSSIITVDDDAKDFKPQQTISFLDSGFKVPDFGLPADDMLVFTNVADTDGWNDDGAPTLDMVKSIIKFVKDDTRVLVHCIGGISRSSAVAIAIMHMRGASIDDAIAGVFDMRPNFWPNDLILQLFDLQLDRKGTFRRTVKDAHSKLDKTMKLWCNDCRVHIKDDGIDNCPGKHFQGNAK